MERWRSRPHGCGSAPLCAEDTEGYGQLLADPSVNPYVVEDGPVPMEAIPARIRDKQRQWAEGTGLVLAVLKDEAFIGYVALHGLGKPKVAISYAIAPASQRQGYAAEAVTAVLGCGEQLAFEQVEAWVHHGNEASVGLLRSVGFQEIEPMEEPPRRRFLHPAQPASASSTSSTRNPG